PADNRGDSNRSSSVGRTRWIMSLAWFSVELKRLLSCTSVISIEGSAVKRYCADTSPQKSIPKIPKANQPVRGLKQYPSRRHDTRAINLHGHAASQQFD